MGKISDIIEEGIQTFVDILNTQYFNLVKEVTATIHNQDNDPEELKESVSSKLSMIFEDFPHDWLFYNEYMTNLINEKESTEEGNDQAIPITLVINLLPIASANHCSQANMEPIFKSNATKTSYDSIVESIKPPFDAADEIHLKLLEHFMTLFVGESLFVFLEKSTEPLSDILVDLLKDIFSYYALRELPEDFTSTISFICKLFCKTQESLSRNFGLMSRLHFEEWYKMLQKAVVEDLNNEEEDSLTPNLKLKFYKYLCITPTRKLVSSHVLFLLNHFNHALSSKRLKVETKAAVLEALKCLLAHLPFNNINIANSSSSMEDEKHELNEDADSPTRLLWPSVKAIYEQCFRLTKVSALKPYAVNVMITVLRKSPKNFFVHEWDGFMAKIKIGLLLELRKTFLEGIHLIYELIKGVEKYGDYTDIWYPKTQIGTVQKGDFTLQFRYSIRKYEWQRLEDQNNNYYAILTPKMAFELCFGSSKFAYYERANNIKNIPEWRELLDIYYKVLLQICIEDLEYGWEVAIPQLLELARSFNVTEYYIAFKVAHKIIAPQGAFIKKYKDLWGPEKDTIVVIDKLKQILEKEITYNFKEFAPNLASYLNMPQSTTMVVKTQRNNLMKDSIIDLRTLKVFTSVENNKKNNPIEDLESDGQLQIKTKNFVYLIELVPYLSCYEFSDSFSSDHLYEEESSDEVTSFKGERLGAYTRNESEPFPIFKYARQLKVTRERTEFNSQPLYEDMENYLPYYLLINSFRISEKVSQSLQTMFMLNKLPRIYILDQISYIIKEVKLTNLDTPKRIVSLYSHIDTFLSFWTNLVKSNPDEHYALQNKSKDQNENPFGRDLEIVLRIIETLCVCNLFTDSSNLKRVSSSILQSAYELLIVINPRNKIDPYQWMLHKMLPLRRFLMNNLIDSEETFKEMFSKELQIFDLIVAKNFSKYKEIFEDNGIIPLLYITEWMRIWLNIIRHKMHSVYSQNLINYINKAAKFKLTGSGFDINFQYWGKDNLKTYLALYMYSSTWFDKSDDPILSDLAKIESMFAKLCLSNCNEYHALSLNKPVKVKNSQKMLFHAFWILYLTPLYKLDTAQSVFELKRVEDPLCLIGELAYFLTNQEEGDYYQQLEHDYLICIYFFYLFHQLELILKAEKISKLKVNNSIGKEIDSLLRLTTNVCKNFNDETSQFSDISHEFFDIKVEKLVFTLVNIWENPQDYAKYFNQTLIFELESKGFSVIKHFVNIIKEIDEDVMTKLLDLSFKEELNKYQMFSILFKLLKESEDGELLKSDSDISSHRSSESVPQISLLTTISSKKNIIIRALLLALYKYYSNVEDIKTISRLFFLMILPYAFDIPECKNEVLNYLEEAEDVENIENTLAISIDIEDKLRLKTTADQELRRSSTFANKPKETQELPTLLIQELNNLIGSDFIPLESMINFSVNIAQIAVPRSLTAYSDKFDAIEEYKDFLESEREKYLRVEMSKIKYFDKILVRLEGIKPTSVLGYVFDFDLYTFLYEMLVLSVKISFAYDEINEQGRCQEILHEIWSDMCHQHTISKVYSFLLFVKYKLQNKISYAQALRESEKGPSNHSGELFTRTDMIITLIFDKLAEIFTKEASDMIIERGVNPVYLIMSRLVLENTGIKKLSTVIKNLFDKFEYYPDLHAYLLAAIDEKSTVDNVFETTGIEEDTDWRVYEEARDHQNLEDSLIVENMISLFESLSSGKNELDYLNKYYAALIENSLKNLEAIHANFCHDEGNDKDTICNVVIMIMISLYNFRHQYKIIEESSGESPTKNKSLLKRFEEFGETIKNLCSREKELDDFIRAEKLSFDTIVSAANIYNILNTKKIYENPLYFISFTSSLLKMLRSTAIACPQLSICLIQCWFPLLSNLVTASIKKSSDSSFLIQYNVKRDSWLKLIEALMISFKRISITKSFEITQVKVVIQCMIRIVKLKTDLIDHDHQNNDSLYSDFLMDDYIYCCNMVFWVCISCIQTVVISSSNRSVRSIIAIGLTSLVALLNEHKFKEFLCETNRFTKNFENYSVFSTERKDPRNSSFSNSEIENSYLCLYDLLFKWIHESEKGEYLQEIEYLLTLEITDQNLCSFDKFDNACIRFNIILVFKLIKMHQINSDKGLTYKLKFSKGLAHIQELKKFLPAIDETSLNEIESCLSDLNEILSNFYAGDEFPFNAIWELLEKIAIHVARYLCANGYQMLVWRIVCLIESIYSSLNLLEHHYVFLHDSIKSQISSFVKQLSIDPKLHAGSNSMIPEQIGEYENEEETKEFEVQSESPEKNSDVSIIKLYKEFFNKNKMLGEKLQTIPSIIAPVYLGIRKIVVQERMVLDKPKDNQLFGNEMMLFDKTTYQDYFCEKDDGDQNPFSTANEDPINDDVDELLKFSQEFINQSKQGTLKKRRSHIIRLSAAEKAKKSKNTSIESPVRTEEAKGIKIPRLGPRKKKATLQKLHKFSSTIDAIQHSDSLGPNTDQILRQSMGTEGEGNDYFSLLNSIKKARKK